MLEAPGLGECPPLRTAKLDFKPLMIFIAVETCLVVLGWMMQLGIAWQVADLTVVSYVIIIIAVEF